MEYKSNQAVTDQYLISKRVSIHPYLSMVEPSKFFELYSLIIEDKNYLNINQIDHLLFFQAIEDQIKVLSNYEIHSHFFIPYNCNPPFFCWILSHGSINPVYHLCLSFIQKEIGFLMSMRELGLYHFLLDSIFHGPTYLLGELLCTIIINDPKSRSFFLSPESINLFISVLNCNSANGFNDNSAAPCIIIKIIGNILYQEGLCFNDSRKDNSNSAIFEDECLIALIHIISIIYSKYADLPSIKTLFYGITEYLTAFPHLFPNFANTHFLQHTTPKDMINFYLLIIDLSPPDLIPQFIDESLSIALHELYSNIHIMHSLQLISKVMAIANQIDYPIEIELESILPVLDHLLSDGQFKAKKESAILLAQLFSFDFEVFPLISEEACVSFLSFLEQSNDQYLIHALLEGCLNVIDTNNDWLDFFIRLGISEFLDHLMISGDDKIRILFDEFQLLINNS